MRTLFTILFCFAASAHASSMTVALIPSTQVGQPGSMLQFTGTLTNNTVNTLFINFDSFQFAINGALDDSPFLNNAPISLDPSQTSSSFVFFNILLPAVQAPGAYDGTFTVLGGTDGNAQDPLGTGSFEVDINTPEPSSLMLFGVGAAALLFRRRRA